MWVRMHMHVREREINKEINVVIFPSLSLMNCCVYIQKNVAAAQKLNMRSVVDLP